MLYICKNSQNNKYVNGKKTNMINNTIYHDKDFLIDKIENIVKDIINGNRFLF